MENRPIFAECGGLMYLMNSIHEDKQVGVYPYNSILTDKVQALKYTIAEVKKDNIISKKGEKFKTFENEEKTDSLSLMVNKGEEKEFVKTFNSGLKKIMSNGEYEKIVNKYR